MPTGKYLHHYEEVQDFENVYYSENYRKPWVSVTDKENWEKQYFVCSAGTFLSTGIFDEDESSMWVWENQSNNYRLYTNNERASVGQGQAYDYIPGTNIDITSTGTTTGETVIKKVNYNKPVYRYVDLGLPSGLLWATTNIGARKEWEVGDYFAFGETSPKENYSDYTYKYFNTGTGQYTKYYWENGRTDNKTRLEAEDDAATVNCGEGWKTPNVYEWAELHMYTTTALTEIHGNLCMVFTSTINGNTITFPTTGFYSGRTIVGLHNDMEYNSCIGRMLASDINTDSNHDADDNCICAFGWCTHDSWANPDVMPFEDGFGVYDFIKWHGTTVRPVLVTQNYDASQLPNTPWTPGGGPTFPEPDEY